MGPLWSAATLSIPFVLSEYFEWHTGKEKEPSHSYDDPAMRHGPTRPSTYRSARGLEISLLETLLPNVNLYHFFFLDSLQISGFSRGHFSSPISYGFNR